MLDLFELHKEDICLYNYGGQKGFNVISRESKNIMYYMRPDGIFVEIPSVGSLFDSVPCAKGIYLEKDNIYYCMIERLCFYV